MAAPVLGGLLQEVGWPTDLCTPDGGAMVIRESTHRFSRFSFHRAMVGSRLPMLCTAAGRAYFAACPKPDRAAILRLLPLDDPDQTVLARSPTKLAALLRQASENGYATNHGEWSQERRFSAIALPIHRNGAVLGSINMIFTSRAMPMGEAVARHLPSMRRAVREIGRLLETASDTAGASDPNEA